MLPRRRKWDSGAPADPGRRRATSCERAQREHRVGAPFRPAPGKPDGAHCRRSIRRAGAPTVPTDAANGPDRRFRPPDRRTNGNRRRDYKNPGAVLSAEKTWLRENSRNGTWPATRNTRRLARRSSAAASQPIREEDSYVLVARASCRRPFLRQNRRLQIAVTILQVPQHVGQFTERC